MPNRVYTVHCIYKQSERKHFFIAIKLYKI